ncbi:MAG: YfhO family protein [Prevotellaceae bacterium]|jgi:hypothetical protein|nr:YfhO family protein [Prevotellaceae bacterium]
MKKENLKKFAPHISAVVLFFVLSIVFFYPVVLENKELPQPDIKSGKAWGNDLRNYHQKTGDYAHWSNAMFSGMPHNYTYSPPTTNVFSKIGKTLTLNSGNNYGLLFIYMLGFYILLLVLGCNSWLSVIGAIAYAFCSYNLIIIEAGHVLKGLVMATMAPIIAGIILCYRGKYLWGAILTLLFTGLNIMWSHQQITFYLLLVIVIMAVVYLVYAIRNHTLTQYFKASLILIVVAMLAIAPSLGKLLPTMDYSKETMRGGSVLKSTPDGKKESSGLDLDYAYQWSYGKAETFTLLIPNFAGASSMYDVGYKSETYKAALPTGQAAQISKQAPMYWRDNEYKSFTSGPVYAGAIICFLFILGLFAVKGQEKWWLLGSTLLSLILAWGRNLYGINDFLFHHLPLYNKFRTPEMALVIANMAMAVLAILAVKAIIENYKQNSEKYLKAIYISAGITGGLCLFFALFGGSLFDFSSNADKNFPDWLVNAFVADRKSMLLTDAWRSLGFIVVAAGLLWFYIKKPFKLNYLLAVLGVLIFTDLWTVDRRFINEDKFVPKSTVSEFVPTEADKFILRDKDLSFRVLNLTASTFNESTTSYFHKSIGGYSPAKLRRYQDIIDYYFSKQINMNILNMLNTKYVIVKTQQGTEPQQNLAALGNAWFVDSIKWVDLPDDEILEIGKINLQTTAVIDRVWKDKVSVQNHFVPLDTVNTIKLIDCADPGHLFYESESDCENFAVFSEVFYKTWHAYIDGEQVPIVRANYILRGLQIPAGKHSIEFKCVDDVFIKSKKISFASSIIVGIVLLGLFGFAVFQGIRRKRT